MAAKTLRLEIVTPEAKAYSEDVDMVVIPGRDGELLLSSRQDGMIRMLVPDASSAGTGRR